METDTGFRVGDILTIRARVVKISEDRDGKTIEIVGASQSDFQPSTAIHAKDVIRIRTIESIKKGEN